MAKREEIREGIAKEVYAFHPYVTAEGGLSGIRKLVWDEVEDKERHYATVNKILFYLHSQGVVIRVDRELPINPHLEAALSGFGVQAKSYFKAQERMLKAGYVAVEPLIEEDNL